MDPAKPNVLTVLFGFRKGGFYARYLSAVRAMADAGMVVHCASSEPPPLGAHPHVRPEVVRVPACLKGRLLFWPVFGVLARRRMRRLVAQHGCDLVFVFDGLYGWLAGPSSRARGVPLLVFVRSDPQVRTASRGPRILEQLAFRLRRAGCRAARVVVAQTPVAKQKLVEAYGLDPGAIAVLPNAVTRFRPPDGAAMEAKRQELGLQSEHKVAVMTARLAKGKRHDIFLRTLRSLSRRDPAWQGLVLGDGERRAELESLADELGVAGRTLFLGWREDVREIVSAADAFVLATDYEGFPNALVEAMTTGVPCFASRIPEIECLLPDPRLLFDNTAAGAEGLAGGLLSLDDAPRRAELAAVCRAESEKYVLDWGEQVVSIVRQAMAGNEAGGQPR